MLVVGIAVEGSIVDCVLLESGVRVALIIVVGMIVPGAVVVNGTGVDGIMVWGVPVVPTGMSGGNVVGSIV